MNTTLLLRCGVIAGPLYLTVGVMQGLLRDGFDFGRHPLSVLANGSLGWIQTANFLLSGLMVIAAAVGLKRVLGSKSRGLRWFLAAYGAAMIAAAFFPADPVDGFPPGTPLGFPTSISTTGLIHFICGALAFLCLAISGFFAAWTMRRRNDLPLALLSLFSGLSVFVGFFGGVMLPIGVAGIWFAVVVGWVWLSVLSLRQTRLLEAAR
ncbi:MAG TPA: DUF998 domain-containing protein [Vicinamibacterales bacterium]|nr:DUF998 domain-containing protein [Vicinamibacterales bacterium]